MRARDTHEYSSLKSKWKVPRVIKSFFRSKKWLRWAYGGAILLIVLIYAKVSLSVKLNDWYGDFYDLLQKANEHSVTEFWAGMKLFMYIVIPWILLDTATWYFTRVYSLRWREAINYDYLPRWRNVSEEIEGASQRIQEDTYKFAKIVESLGSQIIDSILTLVAFTPVLWALSGRVEIQYLKNIPGSLVWLALLVSVGGMIISWFVGIKLPGLEYNNQKVEAAYRKELVYGEDDKQNYASIPKLAELFMGIKFNYHRLFLHYGYFDLWRGLYFQFMVIVPYLVMGPGLFTGLITLGILMKVSNSFDQVRSSLSIFINNWTAITELRSIWMRLHEFEKNLDKYQRQ